MSDTLTGDEDLVRPEFDAPPAEPLALAREWLAFADASGVREPRAASIATAGATRDGVLPIPSVRMVAVKELDDTGFVFTTDASSRKGRELAENPHAALVFYWRELLLQLKVDGRVERLSDEESDRLFDERSHRILAGPHRSAAPASRLSIG